MSEIPERQLRCMTCDKCPSNSGNVSTAQLRGSSFRRRLIEDGEQFDIDHCLIIVGELAVADVIIANKDGAASEHDAEFIYASFESGVKNCEGPVEVDAGLGAQTFCGAVSVAVDDFIEVNY